jgi:hypothetical protein
VVKSAGEAGLTSTKHHYTPRYYLKGFENEQGKIWRRDVETGEVVTGNHAHFGFKNHWNRLQNPPEGYEPDWAEKQIAEVDGRSSSVLNKLLAGELPEDIRPLAHAMGFMKLHQPRLHRALSEDHPDEIADWSPDYRLIVSLNAAIKEGKELEPLGYAILRLDETQPELRFLTSSNPLVDFGNKPNKFFPLTSRACLMLIHDPELARVGRGHIQTDAKTVRGINEIALRNAWQYVYSCRPDFDP